MALATRPPAGQTRTPPEWVVCRGALREVRAGRIDCPLSGRPETVDACLECRYLADVSDERAARRSCSTED